MAARKSRVERRRNVEAENMRERGFFDTNKEIRHQKN